MNTARRLLICLITAGTLLTWPVASLGFLSPVKGLSNGQQVRAPTPQDDIEARVDGILERLSVEERVGQLFMVSFIGQNASPADAVSQLILEYKIGGVVLLEANNNIANAADDNTPAQVANMANQLQTRAYEASAYTTPEGEFFLPLFVAIDHEGDGYPRAHLRNGFTPIPSAMALGATWSPADVQAVGAIVGRELAAVGINMLLGPVVDVLENPRPEGSGDINIRAFGGSPFWVGQLGRAYIRGVHQGGGGRVLTIAKHFPGHGASDRLPDDEVATVNKSLDELRQSDLVPFFAVTRPDPLDPLGVTDGMMPSHIRYRGFQGDVSQLTRPISLDREGMQAFMTLSPLAEWRPQGLVVCDSLGVTAVKSYYDPTLRSFPAKQVAKDALLAGNDLLPLASFAPADQPGWFEGQLPTMQATITFFQEEYRADETFRRRVDDAVRHILRAKLRLYPEPTLTDVLAPDQPSVGQGQETVAEVARKGLTLLYPDLEDLPRRLPSAPRLGDEILIAGCFEDCLPFVRLRGDTVRQALLDLYGPDGSGLVDPADVHLLDFMQLHRLMAGEPLEGQEEKQAQATIEEIQQADWILLVLINYMPDTQPQSGAARTFLRDARATLNGVTTRFDLRDTRIVALALHAPYYLDATEIGKLSAYYAVYSKIDPSLQVALRGLFQEVAPASVSPVSVEGIGYDLAQALRPDPERALKLHLEPAADDVWHTGDELRVRTDPILDRNGHPVPDGTRVRFQGDYADLAIGLPPRLVTDTVGGVAWAVFRPVQPGRLEISASTDGVEADPASLLVAPLATTTPLEAEVTRAKPAATVTAPPATPSATATAPPPAPSAVVSLVSATPAPPSATPPSPPPPDTATSPPSATVTPATPTGGRTSPVLPGLIILGGALLAGALGYAWYRHRGAAPEPAPAPVASATDGSATVSADLEALSPALTGRTLGSCRVDEKLGEGGMGQVYKGFHPMLARTVAIKVLPPALVQSEEMRERFTQEARIAAALRHPNIVQIHDFGRTPDGLFYMIMEFVDGTSLKGRLAGLQSAGDLLPIDQAVAIARQIAEALAYAHQQEAVHRDLKPANILLDRRDQAILVDFGLAVLQGGPRHTEPGKVWGSPTYIAPEQLAESPAVDARSDIYSLGVVLYEMVTGRPPFRGDSLMETLWQQVNVPPRRPSELAPDLPAGLEALILKALAKDPGARYATAQEMAEALKRVEEKRQARPF